MRYVTIRKSASGFMIDCILLNNLESDYSKLYCFEMHFFIVCYLDYLYCSPIR